MDADEDDDEVDNSDHDSSSSDDEDSDDEDKPTPYSIAVSREFGREIHWRWRQLHDDDKTLASQMQIKIVEITKVLAENTMPFFFHLLG